MASDTDTRRRSRWAKRALLFAAASIGLTVLVLALIPNPVPVEAGRVVRGPLVVTVSDEGRTRVPERFEVNAPVAGRLTQIVEEPGIAVQRGQPVAHIAPGPAPLLDPRDLAAAQARVDALAAEVRRARAQVSAAESAEKLARRKWLRVERLYEMGGVSAQDYEALGSEYRISQMDVEAARQAVRVAQAELEAARAALGEEQPRRNEEGVQVVSPASGRVLRVMQERGTVVQVGTPLVQVGDLDALEVVVDVLTEDAAGVRPGQRAFIRDGGDAEPLAGTVRMVEPSGFEHVSALGIEEQRVNVIVDLPPAELRRANLGDGFRVEVAIEVWQGEHVLQVPASALFRHGERWAVFRVVNDEARVQPVTIGKRSAGAAEVVQGLSEGDTVILFPSDRVSDGVSVEVASPTGPRARWLGGEPLRDMVARFSCAPSELPKPFRTSPCSASGPRCSGGCREAPATSAGSSSSVVCRCATITWPSASSTCST